MENTEQNKTKGKRAVIALLLLIIIALGAVIFFKLKNPE